jgi:hypothetical protein
LFLAPGEGDSIPEIENGRQDEADSIRAALRMLRQ